MRSFLLLVLLAVVVSQAAVAELEVKDDVNVEPEVEIPSSRANFITGARKSGDRLLRRSTVKRNAIKNTVRYDEHIYSGASKIRINYIRVVEVGKSQNARAWIRSGGLNRNTVSLSIQSAKGKGYNYLVEIYGK